MHECEFHEPSQVQEACQLASQWGEDARLIAGGTALILALRQRLVQARHLISLARIDALHGVQIEGDQLVIGACATHTQVAQSAEVRAHQPAFAHLVANLANEQVRNQGTLGGNLAYADPTTDPPGCLLALGAQVELQGPAGLRRLPMSEFLVDYFETALQPGELLTRILVPVKQPGQHTTYVRHLRTPADHRPMANVSVFTQAKGHQVTEVRVVVGAATPVPWLVEPATDALVGQAWTESRIEALAREASQTMDALSDTRCDADYRREVVRVLISRSLQTHWTNLQEHAK